MQVADSFRKGVVFLGWKERGKFTPKATGFIASVTTRGQMFFYVVTAQHCVGRLYEQDRLGATREICIRVNRRADVPDLIPLKYEQWWHHPAPDPPSDVAVVPISLDEQAHDFTYGGFEAFALSEKIIREKAIGVGDEVFVVGLFRNHAGRQRNIPIVRIGNIAAMPEEPISTKFGDMEAYLIEARSIGGLSGSPVFVNFGAWRLVDNSYKLQHGYPAALLGLMHGHFDVKDLNADVVLDDSEPTKTGIHSGIGVVVPVSKIIETVMQDDLKAQRDAVVERVHCRS